MSEARRVDVTETATLVRKLLKQTFGKAVKFSVRSDRYSGGSGVYVGWTDGPTVGEVDKVVAVFDGQRFESMSDCTYSADQWHCAEHGARTAELYGGDTFCPNGVGASRCCAKAELVHFANTISTSRELSPETLATLTAAVALDLGMTIETYEPNRFLPEADDFLGCLVAEAAREFAC